ncbi:MAG: hypothetical protein LBD20_00235 [Spirochaetaceae bacterium]|nr:hypothetical protein [Spirochaetaceae bacterium]
MRCRAFLSIALLLFFSASLWGQDSPAGAPLSRQIEAEAAYLESLSAELQMNVESVKHLETLLQKAQLSLTDWETLSAERQREYLALLSDYERLRKKSRNLKIFTAVTAIASFAAGLLTGVLIK